MITINTLFHVFETHNLYQKSFEASFDAMCDTMRTCDTATIKAFIKATAPKVAAEIGVAPGIAEDVMAWAVSEGIHIGAFLDIGDPSDATGTQRRPNLITEEEAAEIDGYGSM